MKKWKILLSVLIVCLFLVSLTISEPEPEETILWKTTQTGQVWKNPDGTYTKSIGQGTQFVKDVDSKWKKIENASSLRNSDIKIKYIDKDVDYELDIIDYNLTHIEYELVLKSKDLDKPIPIRSWEVNKTRKFEIKESMTLEEDKPIEEGKVIEKSIELSSILPTELDRSYKEYSKKTKDENIIQLQLKKTYIEEIGFDKILEIGGNSTTITLQTADTENLADVFICDAIVPPNDSCGIQIKFDISGYSGDVKNSNLCFNKILGASNIKVNITNVNNQSWDESTPFSEFSSHILSDESINQNSFLEGSFSCYNVTPQVSKDFGINDNISIRISPTTLDDSGIVARTGGGTFLRLINRTFFTDYSSRSYSVTSQRPILNITYTPYIDVLSPTPSQIFTEDLPTAQFNITAGVNMDECYYELDSIANFSMNEENATSFNITNNTIVDGTHHVRVWCNQTSDGVWKISDNVTFNVDSLNITKCRDLNVSRTYYLQNDLNVSEECLRVEENLITLDLNGYIIETNVNKRPILLILDANDWITINNGTLYSDDNCVDLDAGGYLNYQMNSTNMNFTTKQAFDEITESGITLNVWNSTMLVRTGSIFDPTNTQIANLYNVTYVKSQDDSDTPLTVNRYWYFDTRVNGTSGNLQGANVSIYNSLSLLVYTGLTDVNGQVPQQELIEYVNVNGLKTYSTPHTINITKTGYATNSTSVNISGNKDYFVDLLSFAPIIKNPLAQFYGSNESVELNYTYFNNTNIEYIWYKLVNSTSDILIDITFLTLPENSTFNISQGDGTYTLTLSMNDTEGVENSDSVTFGISSTYPATVLDSPTERQIHSTNENIYLNFTATDLDGLDTCNLYTNTTSDWSLNYTWNPLVNGSQNYTTLNLTDGVHLWNVWCNDSLGNEGFALNNKTFLTDTTSPIINTTIITTKGTQTFVFTSTITDISTDPNMCNYTIYNSSGMIDGINENVSFTCGVQKSATTTAYGTFTLKSYATDQAGHTAYYDLNFTTSPTTGVTTSGGGSTTILGTAETFAILSINLQDNIDISLSKDSVRPREKEFIITNTGLEQISVEVKCSIKGINRTKEGVNICNYINFSQTTFLVSPNEKEPILSSFTILTPPNSSLNDEFYFNIIGTSVEGDSKLSVSTKVTFLSFIRKWSEVGEKMYPVWIPALIASLVVLFGTFALMRKEALGLFLGLVASFGVFIVIVWLL